MYIIINGANTLGIICTNIYDCVCLKNVSLENLPCYKSAKWD